MNNKLISIMRATGLLAAVLLLSSCQSMQLPAMELPALPTLGGGQDDTIQQKETADGDKELILNPVDVWDDNGGGEAILFPVDGKEMYFRPRPKGTFERAWVRLGLFWHSRMDRPILNVVVGGNPVDITKVRLFVDNSEFQLRTAENFKFTPAKKLFDKKLSVASFSLKSSALYKIAAAKRVYLSITTSRGQLQASLDSATDTTPDGLSGNAKYLFAQFAEAKKAIKP